jgi:hypothetical protein
MAEPTDRRRLPNPRFDPGGEAVFQGQQVSLRRATTIVCIPELHTTECGYRTDFRIIYERSLSPPSRLAFYPCQSRVRSPASNSSDGKCMAAGISICFGPD